MKIFNLLPLILLSFLVIAPAPVVLAGVEPNLCNGDPNGVLDGDEECETGPCCTEDCRLRSAETVCREGGDTICDPSESCGELSPVVDADCPSDVVAEPGTPCDDGLFCNEDEVCDEGNCGGGTAKDCSDENECTDDSCDEEADACVNANNEEPCNDNLFCTVEDVCFEGVCLGTLRICDDENECTTDACNELTDSCDSLNNNTPCDDGIFCNGQDVCDGGSCSIHLGDPCDGPDGDGNCAESCDEEADSCTLDDENHSSCNDGNSCTIGDTCQEGECVSGSQDDPECVATTTTTSTTTTSTTTTTTSTTTTTLLPETTTTLAPETTTTTAPPDTTTTTLPGHLCGDFDGDGELTATDALGVLRAAVGITSCSLQVCDFSGDGKITALDALAVLRAAVGLPSNPSCPPDTAGLDRKDAPEVV